MKLPILATVILAAATASAAPTPDPFAASRPGVERIIGQAFEGDLVGLLADLGDHVGARVTGSPGYARAVAWGQAQLRAAGLKDVRTETFAMAHLWQRGRATGRVLGATPWSLHLETLGWVPATPKGGVRGEVFALADLSPAGVAAHAKELRGKIVLLDRRHSGPRNARSWLDAVAAMSRLHEAGVLAVLRPAAPSLVDNVVATGTMSQRGELMELPAAALGSEDAAHLFRALDAGKVTVELELQSTVTGPAQVPSVIAELPGTDPAAGWILIGAHLDSWDFATGSQDNGAGVIQVIATARALAAAGPLKRTVRFALFGGEEQGMIGSYAYAAAHQAELASCVAMLNTDNGAGHVVGWKVQGRKDVEAALAPIAQGLLGGLGGGQLDLELEADTDHFAFVAAGVPALNLSVDMAGYDRIHHTAADTVEKVDAHALASGVAVLAVTAYALASSTAAFAPHLDRAAVVELLKPEGLDEMMRAFGLWK
jgi:hypothetical protein